MSQIMDAAGNNRGVNVTAGNALLVDGSATTQPANISQVGGSALSLGQKVSASSVPVVLPSDQTLLVQDNFAQTTPMTATWTSATALNTALAATSTDYSSAVITFVGTGTSFATGAVTFETFDGANWFAIQAARTNAYTVDATYSLSVTTQAWEVDVGSWQQVRARLSTAITGTGSPTALFTIILQAAAADPSVLVGQSAAANLNATVVGTGTFAVQNTAGTAGGGTPYHFLSLATTNATNVKASAGTVYTIVVTNTNAGERFFKFFDKATAPTVGTDTPVWTLQIPGNTSGAGMVISLPVGLKFASGISFAITGAPADNDTTAISANDVIVNLGYA